MASYSRYQNCIAYFLNFAILQSVHLRVGRMYTSTRHKFETDDNLLSVILIEERKDT